MIENAEIFMVRDFLKIFTFQEHNALKRQVATFFGHIMFNF